MKKKITTLRHAGNDVLLAAKVAIQLRKANPGNSVVILASTLSDVNPTVAVLEREFQTKAIRTPFLAGHPYSHDIDKVLSLTDQYSEQAMILVTHVDYAYELPTAISKHFSFADRVKPQHMAPGVFRAVKSSHHVVVEAEDLVLV